MGLSKEQADIYYAHSADDGSITFLLPTTDYLLRIRDDDYESDVFSFFPSRKAPFEVVGFLKKDVREEPTAEILKAVEQIATPMSESSPLPASVISELTERDVKILALGEATHGTHEFQKWRVSVAKQLFLQGEFRLFAIEGEFADARRIDEYVTTGKGELSTILSEMGFWTWDTEELLELVRWMRRQNKRRRYQNMFRFFGVDAQKPQTAIADALQVAHQYSIAVSSQTTALLESLTHKDARKRIRNLTDADARTATSALAMIATALNKLQAPASEFDRLSRALVIIAIDSALQTFVAVRSGTIFGTANHRDAAMAQNSIHLAELFPDAGIILWAHNSHVARLEFDRRIPVGSHLATRLGDRYFSIGLSFLRGAFRVRDGAAREKGVVNKALDSPPSFFLEAVLGRRTLFLESSRVLSDPRLSEWSRKGLFKREIGAVYFGEEIYRAQQPFRLYDAIAHFDETTPTRPTPTGRRPPGQ